MSEIKYCPMKCEPLDIVLTVEEIGIDGEISLGRCSRSTAYRNMRRINDYLADNRYDWRVKLVIDKTAFLPYSLVIAQSHKGGYNDRI